MSNGPYTVRADRRLVQALLMAKAEADHASIDELLMFASNRYRAATRALLRHWPTDWQTWHGPWSRFRVTADMRDYLRQLAPPRNGPGRKSALHGIPVLVAELRRLEDGELVD